MKKNCFRMLVFIMLAVVVTACKKDKDSAPLDTKLNDSAIEVDEVTDSKLIELNENEIKFNGSSTQLAEVKNGTILISGITENAPQGYLRKVTSIEKNGSEYIFTTEEVSLTEAFENLDIDYTHKFDSTETGERNAAFNINVSIPNIVLHDEDGNPATLYDQIKFNGNLNIKPEFDIKIRIRKAQLEYAFLGANMKLDMDLSTIFGGSLTGFNKEIKLYEQIITAFVIPGTPIVVTPTISVILGANGSISAQLSYSQNSTGNAGAYLQYNGTWSTDSKKSLNTDTDFSGFAGNVATKAFLEPAINFKFFGSDWAKGSVYAQAYAGVTAQAAPYKPCELQMGVNGGAEANLSFFGKQFASASYPDIFDFSKSIFKCSATPPVNPYLNPNLTYGKVTDIDGNEYATIQIGFQTWMAENLKTSKYNDGTAIPHVVNTTEWSNLTTGAYSIYNYSPENEAIYGKLYNWHAVNTGKLCPQGWHIPTDAEWTQLNTYLSSNVGIKMKSTGNKTDGTGLWTKYTSGSPEGTNASGFTGLPGGSRDSYGTFFDLGYYGYWWSTTEFDTGARCRYLDSNDSGLGTIYYFKTNGFSCRCVKD